MSIGLLQIATFFAGVGLVLGVADWRSWKRTRAVVTKVAVVRKIEFSNTSGPHGRPLWHFDVTVSFHDQSGRVHQDTWNINPVSPTPINEADCPYQPGQHIDLVYNNKHFGVMDTTSTTKAALSGIVAGLFGCAGCGTAVVVALIILGIVVISILASLSRY